MLFSKSKGSEKAALAPAPTPATFQEVYRTHFRMVWRTLGRLGVREADLMDVTQNVFIVVHRQLAGFEGRAELTTWLFSICRLVAKDYLRSAPIRREVVVDVRELARRGGVGESPVQLLDTRELSGLLRAILAKLPEKLRVVFVMFEIEEMSGEEIAQLLEVPVGTVRSRLRLARAAFQREVQLLDETGARTGEASLGDTRVPRMGGI
jgi:RNA polymerase sigma-70 factor (ECF subfamily)